ncbi:MAG: TPM domain-containing protein, partial [Burkholderiaceae bacterium]
VAMFGKLRVWDTENNNGVLIYLLLAEHCIEIVADRGLSRHVDAARWQAILDSMRSAFRAGEFEAGLNQAIDAVNALLGEFFAADASRPGASNPNELPDAPYVL